MDERVRRYRAYYAVDRLNQKYQGQPNQRVPYIRAKIQGAVAHFRGALDQDPFFTLRPYTEAAAKHQPIWETMMERELDRSGSKRQIYAALQEACLTGTGFLEVSVANVGGQDVVQLQAVRFEDMFVTPTGVEDISRVSTFFRFVEPWFIIQERFEAAYYHESAFDRIRAGLGQESRNYDERVEKTNTDNNIDSANTPRELYRCYYRWGNADKDGNIDTQLWHVIYDWQQAVILRAVPAEDVDAFDAPPYIVIRPKPRIDFFYGESYAQVLEGVQNIMDFAYNARLAHDQLAITPITFADKDSELFQDVDDDGFTPGGIYGTSGPPQQSIYMYTPPPTQEPELLLQTARSHGEDATFSDLVMQGLPTSTVRSATEVNALMGVGQRNLAHDLSNIAHDLSQGARMLWSMIYKVHIQNKGVVQVFPGEDQYLIASEEIDPMTLAMHMVEFLQMQTGQQLDPLVAQQILMRVQQEGMFIGGARRDDLEWIPNGSTLVADKQMRANKLERLIAGMLPAIEYATVSLPAWHLMRMYLQSLDFHDWRLLLPEKPPQNPGSPEEQAQFASNMNATRQGGGVGG